MSGINFARLDAAITNAAEHPDEFNMGTWFSKTDCGTTACLAGTAAVQAGWLPVWAPGDCGMSDAVEVCNPDTGEKHGVQEVGAELLGLHLEEGSVEDESYIFYALNLAHVIDIRNEWARDAGVAERTWGGAS